jgi:hypothetical protein
MVSRNEAAGFPEAHGFSGMFSTPGEGRAWKNISVARFDENRHHHDRKYQGCSPHSSAPLRRTRR